MTPPKRLTPERKAQIKEMIAEQPFVDAYSLAFYELLIELDALNADYRNSLQDTCDVLKERDALKAENLRLGKIICSQPHTENHKLRSRVAKLREALKVITSNGLNRGMGWTPSQHARIALAKDDEEDKRK